MKSPKKNGIGEVVTDYGRRVMKIFKKGLLQRSLFDFYGDIKADSVKIKESSSVPGTPVDGDGGVVYIKSADGKLYFKSNEVSEVELSSSGATLTTEQVQDIVGAMFSSNTETNITATYQDADGTIDLVSTDTNTQLTTEEVQDIVGAMFTSNTETRISATYEDSDGTIDLVVDSIPVDLTSDGAGTIHANNVPTLNQNTTGNAATATALETARTIGGVSFNGTANINLPGVNLTGNEDTTGNAATATALENAVNIGGVSFDGTSSINLPGVNASGNQNTSGNAATATLATNAQGITGATDADVTIVSDGEVVVKLDSDNDEINQKFKILNNANSVVFSVQEDGIVNMAGGTINIDGSNSNLELNSGSDFILEADNAGGSGASSIQYLDAGGTNRIMLAANSDVVILSNRAANGTVQIRANTSSAGGGGEVTVVTVEDDKVTISQDLDVTGNVLPGITYVKILPSDFVPDDAGRPAMIDDTGSDRWLESHGTAKLFASVDIPPGFKATHVDIYGSGTSAVTVYEADVNSKTVTSKGTGNIGTQINITDVNSDATNYILIELAQASGEEVYGGKLTIAKI